MEAKYYDLNDDLICLWINERKENNYHSGFNYVPAFVEKPKKNAILFIGLNPSIEDSDIKEKTFCFKTKEEKLIGEDRKNTVMNFAEQNSESKQKNTTQYNSKYYDKINSVYDNIIKGALAENNNLPAFEHTDMFPIREKKSKELYKLVKQKSSKNLTKFAEESLNILEKYIRDCEPSIIIIPNKYASDIFKNEFSKEKCCITGFYKFEKDNDSIIPVVLSGTWQYGRLDDFMKEIIEHHIVTGYNKFKESNK